MTYKTDSFHYVPKLDKKSKERVERYTTFEQIFLGDHREAFSPTIPANAMYINEMFGALISKTSADLLFGNAPTITPGGDEEIENDSTRDFIDSFYEDNETFETNLYEAALSCSYFGDILIELSKDSEGKMRVNFVDPRNWIMKKNLNNEVIEHVLSFSFKYEKSRYVRQKIHRKGEIEHKLFKVKEDFKASKKDEVVDDLIPVTFAEIDPSLSNLDLAPIEFTDVDDFLIFHIPNFKTITNDYGISDYLGLEQLMNALNMLTSFATMILEKHSDPPMEVPKGTIDEDGTVYVAEQKVFQTDSETKGIPRYVTWDGQLTSLFEQRTHVIQMLALYSEIATGLLGFSENGQIPESGRALRLKYARTLMKIARKQRYWEQAIRYIFRVGGKLTGVTDGIDINIQWSDGLPTDYTEELEQAQLEKTVGVKSNETVIRETLSKRGWNNDQIEKEIAKILDETPSTQPNVAPLFTAPKPETVATKQNEETTI